jgi:hypothetical protein
MMTTLTTHLNKEGAGETYFGHLKIGLNMVTWSAAVFVTSSIHGIFPFLLEKTLTREDIDEDDEDRDDIISNIDNMSDRISLYDVCPTQCNAVGCV